jgi:hypothetical protein
MAKKKQKESIVGLCGLARDKRHGHDSDGWPTRPVWWTGPGCVASRPRQRVNESSGATGHHTCAREATGQMLSLRSDVHVPALHVRVRLASRAIVD